MNAVHKIRSHEALTSYDIRKRLKKETFRPTSFDFEKYEELPIAFFSEI